MKYTEQAVETLDDAGSVIANKNIEIEQLRQRVAELEKELEVERMRLVACSTAALGYFNGCCDEYKSASLADVLGLRESNEKLTAERDELLAAAEAIEIDAEECLDFDECTAMLVPIDTYHKLMEAIASVKEKQNAAD